MQSGSVKRRLRDLVNDPSGTFGLIGTRLGEDAEAYTKSARKQ
jgi:hypothetical protein